MNPLSRPLLEGEYHYGFHNYTGPGTRIDLFPNAPPVNDIDNVSRTHDLEYQAIQNKYYDSKRTTQDLINYANNIKDADKKAIEGYLKYPFQDGFHEAYTGIKAKIATDNILSIKNGYPSVLYPKLK